MTKPTRARELSFETLDDVLAEARRIARHPEAPTRGSWSASQNIWHVARYVQASVEGYPFKVPMWMKLLGPMLKSRMINKAMSAGFKTPANVAKQMEPQSFTAAETDMGPAMKKLEHWTEQAKAVGYIPANPVFGKMDNKQWTALHCRHAELHFGLIELPEQ